MTVRKNRASREVGHQEKAKRSQTTHSIGLVARPRWQQVSTSVAAARSNRYSRSPLKRCWGLFNGRPRGFPEPVRTTPVHVQRSVQRCASELSAARFLRKSTDSPGDCRRLLPLPLVLGLAVCGRRAPLVSTSSGCPSAYANGNATDCDRRCFL